MHDKRSSYTLQIHIEPWDNSYARTTMHIVIRRSLSYPINWDNSYVRTTMHIVIIKALNYPINGDNYYVRTRIHNIIMKSTGNDTLSV
jgi:hypothetical protein